MAVDRSLGQPTPDTVVSVSNFLESLSDLSVAPDFHLSTTASHGGALEVRQRILARKPFCTLRQFDTPTSCGAPRVLVVAPLSGQYAVLLQDVVAGLMSDHSVCITD